MRSNSRCDDDVAELRDAGVLLLSSNDVMLLSDVTEKTGRSGSVLELFSSVVCGGGNIMKLVAAIVLKS